MASAYQFSTVPSHTRVVSITSGKGGVGKTSITANLALQLGREGKRVLILDGDFGMANVDIMFNARPIRNLFDVLKGACTLESILMDVAKNVTLIPGGSGVFELSRISVFEKQHLLDQVARLERHFDYMLIDTAPGIDDSVLYLNSAAQEINVIVTPDPASVADSYALIKVLHQRYRENRFTLLCNQVKDEADGRRLFEKVDEIARRFLYVSLDYGGSIVMDPNVRQATRNQQLVLKSHPDSLAAMGIRRFAEKLNAYEGVGECKGSLQFFWEQMIQVA